MSQPTIDPNVDQIARLTAERDQARAECAALIDVAAAARIVRDELERLDLEDLADAHYALDAALYALDQAAGHG